jgi:vacuolar-type H+-ATPase subunit H
VPPAAGEPEEADRFLADARDRAADNLALATEVLDTARLTAAGEAAGIRQAAEAQASTIRRAAATAARQVLAEFKPVSRVA